MKVCPTCNGARRLKISQGWWDKLLRNPPDTEACHFCSGIGEVAESLEEEQQQLARQAEFQRKNDELTDQRLASLRQRKKAEADEIRGLMADDEQVAREVHKLLLMLRISTRSLHDLERGANDNHIKIRMIGEQLNRDGGFDRMRRVGNLVYTLGGNQNSNLLNKVWNGIGQWRN
jgi:hypothetical protein